MQQHRDDHWKVVKRILRYLSGTATYGLHIQKSNDLCLTGYSDSNWGSDPNDRKSTSGFCVYLGTNLISWVSKKQHAMSRSNTKAEYRSLAFLVPDVFWIQNLLDEIQLPLTATPLLYCDNLSAVLLAANPVLHSKSKHFELDLHFVRDHIAKGQVQVSNIPAHAQVTDVLTKPVSSGSFLEFQSKLMIVDYQSLSLRGDVRNTVNNACKQLVS